MEVNVNRFTLEKRIMACTGLSYKVVQRVLTTFLREALAALEDGDTIPLRGIGKIVPVVMPPRSWRSGFNGRMYDVAERVLPKLRPSGTVISRLTEVRRLRLRGKPSRRRHTSGNGSPGPFQR